MEIGSYQKKMEKHSGMKGRLLTRGLNKKVPATGMKNVTEMKRSKSAPPPFGAIGEEKDSKLRKKIKIKLKFKTNE